MNPTSMHRRFGVCSIAGFLRNGLAVTAPSVSILHGAAAVALALGSSAAVVAQDAAPSSTQTAPETAPQTAPRGRVIEGTVNPYTYVPVETGTGLDLRAHFESLGRDAIEWYQHVLTLSNPFFEGRAPGSRGSDLTHEYVEFWMKQAGLEPAFPSEPESSNWTSHRQEWTLPGATVEVHSATVKIAGRELERGKDYQVMGNSGSGSITAPLAFAGYGIEKGPDDYTSFTEGADFAGRIVVLLRYEPLNAEGKSRWASRRFSENSAIANKLAAIAARNPAAIILVNPPGAIDGRKGLEATESSAFGAKRGFPIVQLSLAEADALLKSADPKGRGLDALQNAANEGTVLSFDMKPEQTITLDIEVGLSGTPASNIGGVVRGKGSLAEEWVIIGAHLDHIGFGGPGTGSRERGVVHPGADDNASGTAAMLITARRIQKWMSSDEAPADARSLLFLGFDAEEIGLLGSKEFTRAPTLKLDTVQAMINLDMVGRMRNDEVAIAGVGSAEGFLDALRPTFEASGLVVRADPSGRGPSDHASFYAVGVPVLFLYTGSHDDYHQATDEGFTVNPAGAAKVIALTDALARALATHPKKLTFQSTDRAATRDRGYAGVRLGIQPGLVEAGDAGIKIEAVSPGTSAGDAGIQPGDVLLAWNGTLLESVSDMMEQLRSHKPGDVATLRIKRGEETLEIPVTLKASTPRTSE